ncbi:hypothetical protein GCM10008101_22480 [Lysobacter xinjiangensis]|uniref:DUF58 domain-containing protein n=1 Tax=Cognatilysobacter xinjiangensis TaxID=546892 RepID=A0ABQ3C4H9_9GAMM|nr:DUF58 domain-containing protein [Lysobacter xinjiangensis]GGZ67719.1 hypothetical protein GCM10008101_22480 [Lysobacter xinjiangensis]
MTGPRARAEPARRWPRPAPPLLALLAAWAAIGIAVVAGLLPVIAWSWAGIAIGAPVLVDLARLLRLKLPSVRREMPDTWPVSVSTPVTLVFDDVPSRLRLDVFDLSPGAWRVDGLPRRLDLRPGVQARVDYRLAPQARGDFDFDATQLRLHSPWRLLRRDVLAGAPRAVRVYPNFAPLAKFAMFSAEQASRLVGAHLKRRRGEGTDFHQMREYRVGDSMRQIDWKATARTRRLVSREYQDERNQQVVLLLDTGRRMLARDPSPGGAGEAMSHFDHVLDASLVVGWLALRQGDAVGLLAHGGDAAWVPPQRGAAAIDRLLRATYALQPRPVATDFLAAATDLALRQRRRSLVMLVTNLRDEDMDDVLAAAQLLRRRHVVCVASLREAALDRAIAAEVTDLPGALTAGATAQYLARRAEAHDALRSHGVLVLDVTCAQLPAALVEKYLAVKRDGLL